MYFQFCFPDLLQFEPFNITLTSLQNHIVIYTVLNFFIKQKTIVMNLTYVQIKVSAPFNLSAPSLTSCILLKRRCHGEEAPIFS